MKYVCLNTGEVVIMPEDEFNCSCPDCGGDIAELDQYKKWQKENDDDDRRQDK